MSSIPTELPEPIPPRKKPLPARGRDRQLSTAPAPRSALVPSILATPPARVPILPALPAPRRRIYLPLVIVLAILGMALAIALPIGAGIYYGYRQRETYLERQAVEHYQRALAYESETYNELAVVELQVALKFKPDYKPAQDKLQQLQTASITHNQEPNEVAIAKQLFSSAEDAVARQAWNDAIDLFEELRRVNADYRAADVKAQLVNAYLNAGRQAVNAGQIDVAQRRFEAVLDLDPANAAARALRERAILYFNGVQAAGVDWQTAVLNFQELYSRDPDFYDVRTQLRDAHVGYGEFAEGQGAFCIAAREYGAAAVLGAGSEIAAKAVTSNDLCKQAVVAPTATPIALPAGTGYVPQVRVNSAAACNGIGDITGTVKDGDNQPLANIAIQVSDDRGFRPPPARSFADGSYAIVLGSSPSRIQLTIVNEDGSNASAAVQLDYPGGASSGCHLVVDWLRVQE